MTIVLDLTDPRNLAVEDFNGCRTLLRTQSRSEAVAHARREARHFEAVVRLKIGAGRGSLDFITYPNALGIKVLAARAVLFLFGRAFAVAVKELG